MTTTLLSEEPLACLPTHAFALPGLLPPQTCLVLDLGSRTALRLQVPLAGTPLVRACQLSPSASRVLWGLLHAYPQHCSYQQLFTLLYSSRPEAHRPAWDPTLGLRPVRRALWSLTPAFRCLGLQPIALRKHGYVLAAASPRQEPGATPAVREGIHP